MRLDSRTLSTGQAERLKEALGPQLRYLGRLLARMEKVGFVPSDPLYQKVKAAHDAVHDLHIHVHYLECDARRRSSR